MDDWEKLNHTSFPETEDFYSHLNMVDIIDEDYTHAKSLQRFEIKKLEEYHDLYLQNDTLLLAAVSGNFRNMSFNYMQP